MYRCTACTVLRVHVLQERIKYLAEQVRVLHVLRVTIVMYCTYIVRNLYCMHGEGERTY